MNEREAWPALPLDEWADTYQTLHLWMQVVGKVRLERTPWVNHSWHVTFLPTATGLTTGAMPHGDRTFQIDFDFVDHALRVTRDDGRQKGFALEPQTVAEFHRKTMRALDDLGLHVEINTRPCEIVDPIRFERDDVHRSYDAEYVARFHRALGSASRVLSSFRARFLGKCSPVHFFWGSPDLAVTRFSGRRAPEHRGGTPGLADWVIREAYSHEVSSAGWWPGTPGAVDAAFYSYAYPEPDGFSEARVEPDAAFYSGDFSQFLLPYEAVRTARDPDAEVMRFLQSTYEAAANLGRWDRAALERDSDPRRAT